MLKGLQEVVSKAGSNMNDASRQAIVGLIDSQSETENEAMRITMAHLLGGLIKVLPAASALSIIRNRVIASPPDETTILALNAVLLEAPEALLKDHLSETHHAIKQGMSQAAVVQDNCVLAIGKLLLSEQTGHDLAANESMITLLADSIAPGGPIDLRRLSLVVIRTVGRHKQKSLHPYLPQLAQPIFASVRDPVIPIKLAAEAAFLEIFQVVEEESTVFDEYMAGPGTALPPGPKRIMQDYFKRVAIRLGAQARERKEAEGGQGGLGLAGDEAEDEREVWSVGRVDIGDVFSTE